MPYSELAKEEKAKAWKVIEQYLGTMSKPTKRRDWRITKDGKVLVAIIFSKYYEIKQRFLVWFETK
ncbi:MAG TPA: hypothetical protein VKA70_04000 [Blastocatellia bacterium]|nr:hypothetical protein [Blastocatellia bacterium]